MRGPRIFVLVLLAALAATAHAAAAEEPASSDTCGSCHRDIYRMWRDSAHAKALEDPSVRTSEGKTYDEERIYEKQFVDTGGRRLELVTDLFFAEGLKLSADTRIAPDEARDERFVFPVPRDATAWIGLKLQYEHAPWGEDQDRVWLTFFSETRFVARSS